MEAERLSSFIAGVRETTLSLIADDRLPASQQALLRTCVTRSFDLSSPNDWAQPLGLLYATFRGLGAKTSRKAQLIGAFCVCYLTAGDLFDDIQDDDLAGKALADVGSPIAINTALAMFLVGLRALNEGAQLETDPTRRAGYLDILNRASLIAIGAQHCDLEGLGSAPTPEAVLDMNRGKVACVAMVAECGALVGAATPAQAATFRDFGGHFAALVQIVDDVRDLFGKEESPDLALGKVTHPIACFQSIATPEQKAEFERLRADLPSTLEPIRELLCASGALDESAGVAERLRQAMHACMMALGKPRAELRLLVSMVDALASTLYAPERLEESATFFAPRGGFHDAVSGVVQRFMENLGLNLTQPRLVPWPAPMYLFAPQAGEIHYPDLEELSGEVVGHFVELTGIDAAVAEPALRDGMPLLTAHELFHACRHAAGRLSSDAWHEEFVANRLAMGYALCFEPEAARATVAMSRLVLQHVPADPREDDILERARSEGPAADYDLSVSAAARVHARMLLLAHEECDFAADRAAWLAGDAKPASPESALAAE